MADLAPEDLEVWRWSMDMVTRLYSETRKWPDDEKFGLVSQVRRAAVSVPANIAEGQARGSTKEFLRFIDIALGSLAEVRTLMRIASNVGILPEAGLSRFLEDATSCGRLLGGLKRSLRKKMDRETS
jgi:four helix bundle protein